MKQMLLVLVVGLLMGADDKKAVDQFKGTWDIKAFEIGGNSLRKSRERLPLTGTT